MKVDEKAIEEIAGEYFSSKTPGMALLIGRRGEVVYKKGFEMADIENGIPIDTDTAFIIASITKQFTAMAVMMLKEKGLLDYDDAIGGGSPISPAALGWADGNIISTVEDLFKWHNALYTEKLVKKETLKEAFTPHVLRDGTSTGYGFGWFIGERAGVKEIWHSGGTIGYVSRFSRFVDEGVAVIMLTNCYDLAGPKRDELFDRIVNVVFAGLGRKIP